MEYRTVSAKLPADELTMFKAHCKKKGLTPANLLRKLILRETQVTIPIVIAGKNRITYNKNTDSFTWSLDLDAGKKVDFLENVPVAFIENLTQNLKIVIEERETAIQKIRKESVPIPSDLFGGKTLAKQ